MTSRGTGAILKRFLGRGIDKVGSEEKGNESVEK
jgi:hypothetical protein